MVKELHKVIDTSELLSIKSELIALQVEVLERLILTESLSELCGTFWPEKVAFELELSERFICVEHFGKNHSRRFFHLFSDNVDALQGMVVGQLLGHQKALDVVELIDACHCVLEWSVLVVESL